MQWNLKSKASSSGTQVSGTVAVAVASQISWETGGVPSLKAGRLLSKIVIDHLAHRALKATLSIEKHAARL